MLIFLHCWPFARGIHRSRWIPSQQYGRLVFALMLACLEKILKKQFSCPYFETQWRSRAIILMHFRADRLISFKCHLVILIYVYNKLREKYVCFVFRQQTAILTEWSFDRHAVLSKLLITFRGMSVIIVAVVCPLDKREKVHIIIKPAKCNYLNADWTNAISVILYFHWVAVQSLLH